jgi:hypothetical protein
MNLAAIARKAVTIGERVAGQSKVLATLKLEPTAGAYDAATDTTATTTTDVTRQFVAWDDDNKDAGDAPEKKRKKMLVPDTALPAGKRITQSAQVVIGAETWEIVEVQTDPTGATNILTLQL